MKPHNIELPEFYYQEGDTEYDYDYDDPDYNDPWMFEGGMPGG